MTSTSTETPGYSVAIFSVADDSDRCEACGTSVDLTKTVLLGGTRIVACSDCTWGSVSQASA